jgi:hypothetical protein
LANPAAQAGDSIDFSAANVWSLLAFASSGAKAAR